MNDRGSESPSLSNFASKLYEVVILVSIYWFSRRKGGREAGRQKNA